MTLCIILDMLMMDRVDMAYFDRAYAGDRNLGDVLQSRVTDPISDQISQMSEPVASALLEMLPQMLNPES